MALTDYQRNALRHPLRWLFNNQPEDPDGNDIPRRELTFFTLGLWGKTTCLTWREPDASCIFA